MKMKLIQIILIISILILISCTRAVEYNTVPTIVDCGKPSLPIYNTLDPKLSLENPKNRVYLLDNLMIMSDYIEQLEQTINCYEGYLNEI